MLAQLANIRDLGIVRAAFGGGDTEVVQESIDNLIRQGRILLDDSAKLAAG